MMLALCVWFETHENQETSSDLCRTQVRGLLGKPIGRKRFPQTKARTNGSEANDPFLAYIQDILGQKVDAAMSEESKVGRTLKGVADDAFQLLAKTAKM